MSPEGRQAGYSVNTMSSRSDSAISGFSRSVTRRRWRSTAVLCALAMVGSVLVGTGPVAAAPLTAQTATNDDVIGGLDDLTAAAEPPRSLVPPGTYEIDLRVEGQRVGEMRFEVY